MDKKKPTRKDAIKVLEAKGEPIEPNAHCEALIDAELQELLNDREEYRP